MKCEKCQGEGLLGDLATLDLRPCWDCGGSGITHCCEGQHEVTETLENVNTDEEG